MMLLTPLLILTLATADGPTPVPAKVSVADPGTVWNLTLPEAIRLGLVNSEIVQVVSTGTKGVLPEGYTSASLGGDLSRTVVGPNSADIVVARTSAEESNWRFKASLMAHVRSIEQTYWALWYQQVNLASRETAIRLGEAVLKRERAELEFSRATNADIAETEQQVANFKLNLVTATADLTTTERQLRNILGISAGETRRIVAITAPVETEVKADWELSVKQMHGGQPDLALQRELLAATELKIAFDLSNHDLSDAQRIMTQQERDRQQTGLQQIVHETTHTLARFFLEVDANYKQFQTANRLKVKADQRLEAQRAFYEEGRITIDRLLDAISQQANAVAQEAQYKASFNTSIAAFEEAIGTLLAFDGVTVTQEPRPKVAPANPTPAPSTAVAKDPATTNYKVRASIAGLKLIDVEVEINQPNPSAPK